MMAKGSIYGTKDAARAFWIYLRGILLDNGAQESQLEPALFFYTFGGILIGIMGSHVDDVIFGYDDKNEKMNKWMDKIAKDLHMTVKRNEFNYCGKHVVQEKDGTIYIDMEACTESLTTV